MRKHYGAILLCLLGALIMLLLLTALVRGPGLEEEGESVPKEMETLCYAELSTYLPVSKDSSLADALVMARIRIAKAIVPILLLSLCCHASQRDNNGHWLVKRRYVNSVYQIFRQEIAYG